MIGIVLAAGTGTRLRPHTDALPKTLVPIGENLTILDVTLGNFAAVGISDVAIVVGHRAERIVERVPSYEARLGIEITIVDNDRADTWNNAYSLWRSRALLESGAVVANGDTLHPASVERCLLLDASSDLTLAVDSEKRLGDEEMKVELGDDGFVHRISKLLPHDSHGEYIGVALVPAAAAGLLVDALERTWTSDPSLFYEDAFQLLADEGATVRISPIGDVPWTEIDDESDLLRAKELACLY